jgi:hypothetical protein
LAVLWEKLDFYIVLVGERKYNENRYRRPYTLLKIGVLNNTHLVLLNTLCVLQQHTLCAKLDDHYILEHLNVFVNTQGVLNSTVRNGSVFCNTPFI